MKPSFRLAVVVILLGGAWLAWHTYSSRVKARQQRDRAAAYAAFLSPYQRDLRVGMTRADVKTYLESHHIEYSEQCCGDDSSRGVWSYVVRIAEERADEWYCDRWFVYVSLEFIGSDREPELKPLPTDRFKKVKIRKVGHCL